MKLKIDSEEFTANSISKEIKNKYNLSTFNLSENQYGDAVNKSTSFIAFFLWEGKEYYLSTIPHTKWIAIASIDYAEVQSAGTELIWVFLTTAFVLGLVATLIIIFVSNQISQPLTKLANTAEEVKEGDLNAVAEVEGSVESATLANNFNELVTQVKSLLTQQQQSLQEVETARKEAETLAEEQKKTKRNHSKGIICPPFRCRGCI